MRAAACLGPAAAADDLPAGGLFEAGSELAPAAVLVPIVDRAGEATVLLTRRSEHLPRHAGQIAFPGGRIATEDGTLYRAALRETEEETGIAAASVDIIGRLERHDTGTGFAIYPVLGVVAPGFRVQACAREVAEVFEVPLGFLMTASHYRREAIFWRGENRRFYVIDHGSRRIWGATAAILKQLQERLYGA